MSEPTATEARLTHLNLVLRAIRDVNQLILQEKDRDRLVEGVCRALIQTRGYHNAWIALLDASGGFIFAAEAGLGEDFLPLIDQLTVGRPTDCSKRALAQATVVVTDDPVSTCADCPLAWKYGGRGGLAARLEHGGRVYGLLCASIPAHLAADPEEHSLFEGVAGDVAFALHNIELAEERRQAEEALRESESRYRDLFENAAEAIFLCSASGGITSANRACETLTGYSRDELARMSLWELFSQKDQETVRGMLSLIAGEQGAVEVGEFSLTRKDGMEAFARLKANPVVSGSRAQGVQIIALDVTEERRLRQNMQYYIAQITRAQEDERLRISRELHDDTAQSLAGLSRDLRALISGRAQLPEAILERLEQLRATADTALQGVRRFSQDLRPSILDDLGLLPALEWLVASLEEEHGIPAMVAVAGTRYRLSPEKELIVFRIVQETLSNVRRHSGASAIEIGIDFGVDALTIMASDNGQGFHMPQRASDLVPSGRLGIVGMRERARLADGTIIIQSEVGKGTTVTLRVPR